MLNLDLEKYRYSQSWFCESEIKRELLNFLSARQVNNILEIGSFEGLSGTAFSDNLLDEAGSSLDCVDPFILSDSGLTPSKNVDENVEMNCRHNISKSKNAGKCTIHKMKSDEFFRQNTKTYNFIYIDGSHEVDAIQKDMKNSFDCLQAGGLMWMDDYMGGNPTGVIARAMDEMLESFGARCKLVHKGYQIAITKIDGQEV